MTEVSPYAPVEGRERPRGSLSNEAADYIRDLVFSGALKPGTKIDQDAVGDALGVSRSPVREALVILGQEGLLDVTPRRGAAVAALTPEDVIDHFELFGIVAGRAAAMAAQFLGDDEIRELSAIHARFVAGNDDELTVLNEAFHRIINGAAPRRTRWLLGHLGRSVPANFYEFNLGWNDRAVEHHAAILDAITRGDPEAARRCMEQHLHESGVAAAESLRSRGFWDSSS